MRKMAFVFAITIFLSGCNKSKSESEMKELAVSALEKETGSPSITIEQSFFGQNKGGVSALCGHAKSVIGGAGKFVVVYAKDGEFVDIGKADEPVTWSVFCGDDARSRYDESAH